MTSPLELDLPTMRSLGHRVADLVAEHHATIRSQPASRSLPRSETRALIAEPAPEGPADFEDLLAFLRERVFPYHVREPHPGFMAYVQSCPTFPAILGDWIATGFNFFAGVWPVAAGPNELELTVLDWFRTWIGMPEGTGGLLTTGGSAATFTAIVAARHAALGERSEDLPRLVLYTSDQAHSAVVRAGWIAGIPRDQVRAVAVDGEFRLRMDALAEAVARDRERGLLPFCVAASAGTTNTGAVDPLDALADYCGPERLWLHVDAAYGGFAALTERGRAALAGIGRADSVTLDPHKWLFVPFECGCLLVRDPARLREAFHILPEYLRDVEARGEALNFADYGEQLTRYARAFKVWLSVKYYGTAALRDAIDGAITLAQEAETLLRREPGFEILSPARLSVVCFRARPPGLDDPAALDGFNERLLERVNADGRFFLSSTRLRGAFALRICVVGYRTTWEDIVALVEALRAGVARSA